MTFDHVLTLDTTVDFQITDKGSTIRVNAYTSIQALQEALRRAQYMARSNEEAIVPVDVYAGLSDAERASVEQACADHLATNHPGTKTDQ